MDTLPLTSLLGPHVHRLRGIEGWSDLDLLGTANLAHLLDFARKAALDDRDSLDRSACSAWLGIPSDRALRVNRRCVSDPVHHRGPR